MMVTEMPVLQKTTFQNLFSLFISTFDVMSEQKTSEQKKSEQKKVGTKKVGVTFTQEKAASQWQIEHEKESFLEHVCPSVPTSQNHILKCFIRKIGFSTKTLMG